MSAIKKFFEKRKADAKFKAAGPGHSLKKSGASKPEARSASKEPVQRVQPSQSSQMAGVAALQRIQQQQQRAPTMANRSLNVIRAEARKEIEQEKLGMAAASAGGPKQVLLDSPPVLSANGILFSCSLIGPELLQKEQMEIRIREFLYQEYEQEPELTSCLIIQTCNKNRDKVNVCVETLVKCLSNIVEYPTEEKYRKIRCNTKTFQDKIAPVEGAVLFLEAAGFEKRSLPYGETGAEEDFYVFKEEKLQDIEGIIALRDALVSAEPIRPELNRNIRVFRGIQNLDPVESLPQEFFNLTIDDIKREQMLKAEEVEKNLMLRTKAMKERDATKELRRYRYCLVRIRFPDGVVLQGTFKTWEKFSALTEFVRENLALDLPFVLTTGTGQLLNDDESTLAELGLVPAVIINFSWDPSIADDVGNTVQTYLKSELVSTL